MTRPARARRARAAAGRGIAPRRAVQGLALAVALALGSAAAAQEADGASEPTTRVRPMATGAVTGAYFPVGVSLCRVSNEGRREHGLRCSATPSEGSIDNIERLRRGEADFAILQSDVQAAAVRGEGGFANAAYPELRAVAALYPEPLTLITRGDAGIGGLADLPGKRVSLGPPGSGQRVLIDDLMARLGWRDGVFAETPELGAGDAVTALCEGRLDAFFYAVGHPAEAVAEATSACGGTLAPVTGPEVEAMIASGPFYFAAEVPGGLYAGVAAPVPTFGVGATLAARADVPAGDVEILLGAILEDLPALAGFAAPLATLDRQAMPRRALAAPLHPGAEAAYRARGLIE